MNGILNEALIEFGHMLNRSQEPEPDLDEEDVDEVKARCRQYLGNLAAGVQGVNLPSADIRVLWTLSGARNRLPKELVTKLGLIRLATYSDTLQSAIFAVQQKEMVSSWR
jgi:hypothetical protein